MRGVRATVVFILGVTAMVVPPRASLVSLAQTAGSGWHWLNPLPQGNDLWSIACPTSSQCIAVGRHGTILATTDGGHSWIERDSGTDGDLFSIACPTVSLCYVTGAPPTATLLVTGDGGSTWEHLPTARTLFVGAIACPGPRTCYGVGGTTACCLPRGANAHGPIVLTTDGGRTWHSLKIGVRHKGLNAIACPRINVCYAVGDYGTIVATTNGGKTWSRQASHSDRDLTGVSCPTVSACFAVGWAENNEEDSRSTGGEIVATKNGGIRWKSQLFLPDAALGDVTCPNDNVCYVAGGIILSTSTGGRTWSNLGDHLAGTIACPGTTVCYALSDTSRILTTIDGGVTWVSHGGGVVANVLVSIACPAAATCYAAGSTIVGTSDGGRTWTGQIADTSLALNGIACPSMLVCDAVGLTQGANYHNLILATSNGGRTWSRQRHPRTGPGWYLTGIACPTTATCYAIGDGSGPHLAQAFVLKTGDGGKHWKVHNGIAAALAATASPPGNTSYFSNPQGLASIACPTASVCYVLGGLSILGSKITTQSVIVATTDGGVTWRSQAKVRRKNNRRLSAIACADASACYAVGSVRSIYSTTNGGITWATHPTGTTGTLNGIACATRTACDAVGDPGAIVSTVDGVTWHAEVSPTSNALLSIACPDANGCYAVGVAATILSNRQH